MDFHTNDDELQDFREAIDALEAASKVPAKSRARKISPTVDEICEHAYQFGFPSHELLRVINLVTVKTELDQSTTTTIIKTLYPAGHVPAEAVCSIVASLGHAKRKPSSSTQAALLRWLSAIHGVLEDHSILTRFYAVLFNLLDMITIRAPLCHLLALITRRKHVRPFRIQRLLELSQQSGNEPALTVLMRVYKNFCPEIILSTTSSGRSSIQSQLDFEWQKRLQAIQDISRNDGLTTRDREGFKVARNGTKRTKLSVLPELHTFHASEALVTLEDVENADHFVDILEKIEPPSQLVAGLRDPLLQKYLMLGSSADSERRLEFWLLRYLGDELETLREGFGLSATLSDTLSAIVSYSESSKALLPIVQQFLATYIPIWNGSSDLGLILDLVAYIPPQPFADLHRVILAPLEQSILHGAYAPFDTLFELYANLAQRWIGNLENTATHKQAYDDMAQHVSISAQSALTSSQASSAAILTFYEKTADATSQSISAGRHYTPLCLPPPSLLYPLAMTPSLSTISRVCAVLTTYKIALETQIKFTTSFHADCTRTLNGYLMDICNLLWRSRALTTSDANSFGCLCPEDVGLELQSYISRVNRDYALPKSFDFSHNPLLSSLSLTAFAAFEAKAKRDADEPLPSHAGPVTQQSLIVLGNEGGVTVTWKQYRVMMLNWLEERGVDGFKKLMFATMKDLMK